MSLQVIRGGNGKPSGVFIPINEWEMMKEKYQDLKDWEESEARKTEILTGIKEAVDEVKLIKSGKLKAKSLKEILDEL
jgi:PHD/YefM family antitoxin component YafN of YafNO toxin-antitoxin module